MAVSRRSNDLEDDEYIEMEVNSYSNFLCNSSITSSPPPQYFPMEFQFQTSSSSSMETEPPTTSSADQLFYKGKLLPLHLLHNSPPVYEDFYWTPLTTTPFESCNVSPSESCRISRELNLEECLSEYSADALSVRRESNRKKSSSLLSGAAIGSKLKAYRAYMKSLFSKTGCSSESCSAAKVADEGSIVRAKEWSDRSVMLKSRKKAPFGQIRDRRSFSSDIKRQHSRNKSSSSAGSSSSQSSIGVENSQFLKRSNSMNVEIESPIQGAIAHCKQSQQLIRSNKIDSST